MRITIRTRSSSVGARRWIAAILALAVVAASPPLRAAVASGGTPDGPFLLNGDRIFRIDLGQIGAAADLAGGFAAFDISISRAIFPGEDASSDRDFAIDESSPDAGIVVLESAAAVQAASGRDPSLADGWQQVAVWSIAGNPFEISTTYHVGQDRVTTSFPRDLLGFASTQPEASSVVTIDVNGFTTQVDPALIERALNGEADDAALQSSFAGLDKHLYDPDRFNDAVRAFAVGFGSSGPERLNPMDGVGTLASSSQCVFPCLRCAGALLGSVATAIALIAACGSVVFTGGAAAAACIAAYIAHNGAVIVSFAACGECLYCADRGGDDDDEGDSADPPDDDDCCDCAGLPSCPCASVACFP